MAEDNKMDLVIKAAYKIGAIDVKRLKAEDVVVRDWVRLKCQFGCDQYALRLTCPPNTPSPEEFRKILKEYEWTLLLQFEAKDMDAAFIKAHENIVDLEKQAFLEGYYKAFGLASGSCPYCTDCDKAKCKHPERARPSMEAMGIDVFATVKNAGIDLTVVKDLNGKPRYFGLLMLC